MIYKLFLLATVSFIVRSKSSCFAHGDGLTQSREQDDKNKPNGRHLRASLSHRHHVVAEEDTEDTEKLLPFERSPKREITTGLKSANNTRNVGRQLGEEIVVLLYWHVILGENGKGGVSDEELNEQLQVINREFAKGQDIGAKRYFRFYLAGTSRESNNPEWFKAGKDSPDYINMATTTHRGGMNALNVWSMSSLNTASFPWENLGKVDGTSVNYATLPGGSHRYWNMGFIGVHEIGHWLGLYHIFEFWDQGVTTNPSNQERLPNGSCDYNVNAGDLVADTPIMKKRFVGYDDTTSCRKTKNIDTCPTDKDANGNKIRDDFQNHMDYSSDICKNLGDGPHFTPGQWERMLNHWDRYRKSSGYVFLKGRCESDGTADTGDHRVSNENSCRSKCDGDNRCDGYQYTPAYRNNCKIFKSLISSVGFQFSTVRCVKKSYGTYTRLKGACRSSGGYSYARVAVGNKNDCQGEDLDGVTLGKCEDECQKLCDTDRDGCTGFEFRRDIRESLNNCEIHRGPMNYSVRNVRDHFCYVRN